VEVYPMAEPIDYNLVLEGDDAKTFLEDFDCPKVSKKKIAMFKKARAIYGENPV
jgi:hypothetical protein